MKRLIYAAMLLLGLSILGSCNKEEGGGGGSGNLASTIIGSWVIEWNSLDEIDYYIEFTKDKRATFYELSPSGSWARYDNGVLYAPDGCEWEKVESFQYSIADGKLDIEQEMMNVFITKVNNDKLHVSWNGENYWYRVKKFRTE